MTAAPVVGRDAQLEQLDRILGRALAGDAVVCFVTGEPGAGKTSLVSRFAERAQSATPALLVAVGTCDAYTGAGDAYLPFRDLLQQLTGDAERSLAAGRTTREGASRLQAFGKFAGRALVDNGADLIGLFVPAGALLARLGGQAARNLPWVQQLQHRLYDGGNKPMTQSLQRENVFEQYTHVLEAMAAQRPLLLVVDDLHWADSASLGLLFHIARRLVKSPLLILGTYRAEEVSRPVDGKPHPLQGVVAELKRLYGEATVDLDNLGPGAFVDALLDARPNALDAGFREALARHTAGNPLFAVELLQSLTASGVLVEDAAGRLVQVAPIEWRALPSRVAGVIESRVRHLSAIQNQVLSAAAVQGEEFVADIVAEVLRTDRRDVIGELSGPLQKELRLVSAIGLQDVGVHRVARYCFRHNLVQDYLYRQLDEIERAELHAETGLALEALHAAEPASVAVSLAAHFTAAGDWSRAIRYRLVAADVARRSFAHEQSVEHLEQALALDERHGGGAAITPLQRAAAVETLADELLLLRRWIDAESSYRDGMRLADPADRVSRARLLRKLARVHERQSRYAEASELLEEAQAALGDLDPHDPPRRWQEWIEIQLALSMVYYWTNSAAGMDAVDARLEPLIESRGSPAQLSEYFAARVRRGFRQTRYWSDEAMLDSASRALATLERYPDEFLRGATTFLLGFTQLWAERFDEAADSLNGAASLCRRVGDSLHRLRSLVYLSVGRRRQGQAAEVARLNDEARDLMRQIGSDEYLPVVLAQDTWLAWRGGDLPRARSVLEQCLQASGDRTSRLVFQWLALWVKVAMDLEDGDLAGAATAAAAMLKPPLARQRTEIEDQLQRIAAAHADGAPGECVARELATGVELARRAGYL